MPKSVSAFVFARLSEKRQFSDFLAAAGVLEVGFCVLLKF